MRPATNLSLLMTVKIRVMMVSSLMSVLSDVLTTIIGLLAGMDGVGAFIGAGQTCVCASRHLVQASIYD